VAEEIGLSVIAELNRRILEEMASLRAELHDGLASVKDDMNVLTAIVLRLEGHVTRRDQRLDRFSARLRQLEEARG
jgi:septal ring factor EnvC (AmiA/AmiB activator)